MTVVSCGRTNLSERAEAITRAMREEQGFCLDVGCGRSFDLDNQIQHMGVYRCCECARWLCKSCILAHFEATNDAYPPTDSRGRRADGQRESDPKEVQHQRHSESGRGAVHDSNAHAVPFHTLGAGQPESNGTNRVCGLRPDADRSTNETPTRL